jgi:hypothetical protein
MIQEAIINEVRQRLGPLNSQAEQAVKEVLEILKLPRKATSPETQETPFIGTNVSVAQYEAWSRDERLKYQTDPEKINARWIEKKLQELNAAWIIVIDSLVVASGSLTDYPSDEEFDALCEKFGKFPFVFLSPRVLMIEENISWHETIEEGDAYPTVPVAVKGATGHVEIKADFDTGAIGVYFDQELLLRHKVMTRRDHDIEKVSQHLGKDFRYVQKPLWLEVTDKYGKSQRVGMIALCIENWQSSPFVAINPQRIALVGREAFLKLQPIVHLDFAARQTEIEYERLKGI